MTGVILVSDVLIELLRGRNPAISSRFETLLSLGDGFPICYSAVSVSEIRHGQRENEVESVESLFSLMKCLPVQCGIADEAGIILRRFRKSHAIGLGDALIAATALHHSVVLWTRNRKHYPDSRLAFFDDLKTPA